ncbi:MAG: hypothetical protein HY880_08170, partial [Deltaproteobacteria bacterium]|nr:hypothetical protein [Deltaproteobacteria bacterium]
MDKVRFSLGLKAFIAVVIILLPIFITFLIGYQRDVRHLKQNILDDLAVIAEAYEGQVYQFLEMSRRRVVDFSSDGFIRKELKKLSIDKGYDPSALNNHIIKNKKS